MSLGAAALAVAALTAIPSGAGAESAGAKRGACDISGQQRDLGAST